ncbi:Gfo/Idh/MocA family protein [Gephyromycinifex aptenodytis]|uniref:Gfo/Idh/MocA family protein n=1 Tax=Gephyromycinifex aptenodytis TaxID=2716227 RepID=UPI001448A1CA|nr:Gfo/Idh/MocA family oxidoreductase [Gephyromycinifex aptenodytis]
MSHPPLAPFVPAEPSNAHAGDPVRWGFIGAGHIALKMARAITAVDGHRITRVGAREATRAQALADEFGGRGGSYEDVYTADDVDVVYINTTHPFHLEQALAAMSAGKAVLVEKPLTLSAEQATRLADAAEAAGVFAMEAMWLRTQPIVREVCKLVGEGEIGDLVSVNADFSVIRDPDPTSRLFDIDNGGGALLDLGVYPAHLVWPLLGRPDSVQVMGTLASTGADHVVAMQWGYETGAFAQLSCTFAGHSPGRAVISGRSGWITIEPHYAKSPEHAVIFSGGKTRTITLPSRGYQHQVEEVGRCLRAGLTQSPLVPLSDTIGVLEVMDCARSELGVRYPQE